MWHRISPESAMPHRSTYVVVEPMRLIAEDLALDLADHDPEGKVLVAASEHEAMALVEELESVTLAIVHAAPASHPTSALGQALAKRGAVSVLIGDRAEEQAAQIDLPVLQRPYAPEVVLALLARLLVAPGLSPGA
jgi:hypothetical protein